MITPSQFVSLTFDERDAYMATASNADVEALRVAMLPGDADDTLRPAAWRDALYASQAIDPTRVDSWRAFCGA